MVQSDSNHWLNVGARAGHLAKGIVYALIGVLAIQAAVGSGGQVGGGEEVVQYLGSQPFGQVLLVLIGAGLSAYSLWRFLMAAQDTEGDGNDGAGIAKRAGYASSGLMNAAVAFTALQMALGGGGKGGGAKTWTADLMSEPFGQVLVGILGVSIVGVGAYQLKQAYTKSFLDKLELSAMSQDIQRTVTRLGQLGHAARGVIFPIIGVALVTAAITHDPSEAKGVGDALRSVAASTFGQVVLIVVAAGLLAYGAFTIASAKYRHVNVRVPGALSR